MQVIRKADREMTATGHFVPYLNIKIGSQDAAASVAGDLIECVVENSLHIPDACILRLLDDEYVYIDSDLFKEGTRIQISTGWEGISTLTPIFDGEIVGIELDLLTSGKPRISVRAYSRGHRLHRGRQTKSFVQMTDSDIVNQIGQAAGFTVSSDATTEVHDWVLQNNQTDWEFLSLLAQRNGYRLYVQNQKDLHFSKVVDTPQTTVTLAWGEDLFSFHPRTSASRQVNTVTVRGWDPQQKQVIVGTCTTASGLPQVDGNLVGSTIAQTAFGAADTIVVNRPIWSQSEAEDLAKSIYDDIGGRYLQAHGICYGNPYIMPGVGVKVEKVGNKFSGTYLVTSTRHVYSPNGSYDTHFSIDGKRPSTLMGLLGGGGHDHRPGLGGSIVIGIVTDNNDPNKQGRVKVKYPWLTEDHTSFWVRQAAPMGGKDRGFYFLPEIDDEVLIAFEHGDINRPYVVGALWNGKDTVIEGNDVAVVSKQVVRRTIKTRIGHTVLLDDTDGTGQMSLTTKAGNVVCLNDKDKNIYAETTAGHKFTLDDQNSNIVIVDKTGNNKMTIDSNSNSITIECVGDFKVNATGKVSITGTAGIALDTPAQLTAQGQTGVTVTTPMSLKLSGDLLTDVESSTLVKIQGTLVTIN
jgi:phage protein D